MWRKLARNFFFRSMVVGRLLVQNVLHPLVGCRHTSWTEHTQASTYGDSDVISFHITVSWFSPPSCG